MSSASAAKRLNESLSELLIQGDVFTRKMAIEKKRVEEINESIAEVDRQIGKFQHDIKANAVVVINLHRDQKTNVADGWNPLLQGEVSHQKMVSNLESRLNKFLVRQAQTETDNLKIKKHIDQLRRNRLACDANRKRLEADLKAKQAKVARLLENSGAVQEEHKQIIKKQGLCVQENQDEALECVEECERLGKYIEDQNIIVSKSVREAAKSQASGNENMDKFRGDFDDEEEAEMRRTLASTNEEIARNQSLLKDTQEKIDELEEGFARLRIAAKQAALDAGANPMASSDLDDIQEIEKLFIQNQDETFSVVKFIQEVIKETDSMKERTETIDNEFKLHKKKMEDEEAERAENVRKFNEKIAQSQEEIATNTTSIDESQRVIDMLAKKVQRLFYKIQCDQVGGVGGNTTNKVGAHGKHQTDSQLLLAGGGGVNESNILKFMQIIEKRTVELIAEYSKLMNRENEERPIEELKATNTSNDYKKTIQPPDSHAESDDDDFESSETPMVVSLNELHKRTATQLSQAGVVTKRGSKKEKKNHKKSTVFLTDS